MALLVPPKELGRRSSGMGGSPPPLQKKNPRDLPGGWEADGGAIFCLRGAD